MNAQPDWVNQDRREWRICRNCGERLHPLLGDVNFHDSCNCAHGYDGARKCPFCSRRAREMQESYTAYLQSKALEAAPEDWRGKAWRSLKRYASTGMPFTSEDILGEVGLPSGTVGQHRNNAVGALFAQASKEGLITRVGYDKSKRQVSHGAVLSVWRGKRSVTDATPPPTLM